MIELDFLELDEVIGENRLDIFKKLGVQAKATDFSIMLGAYVPKYKSVNFSQKDKQLYAGWWTKTYAEYSKAYFINANGNGIPYQVRSREYGVRPVIKHVSKLNLEERVYTTGTGITCVHYGEYPQTVARKSIQNELQKEYTNNRLKETGRIFTTDTQDLDAYVLPFEQQELKEYEYKGKKIYKNLWYY